jgi:alpha-tubulin suppressor-like RCC1 family protein
MKKRKMNDVDASTESSKYQYNPLDQMYIELSRILYDKHDEEVHLSELFSYGDGSHFQLGHGDSMPRHTPKKVKALEGENIALLACSDVHSAALTSDGHLFTWYVIHLLHDDQGYLIWY